jgi:hypothetical protein
MYRMFECMFTTCKTHEKIVCFSLNIHFLALNKTFTTESIVSIFVIFYRRSVFEIKPRNSCKFKIKGRINRNAGLL